MLALVSVLFLLRGLDTLESIFKLLRKTLHGFHGALGKLEILTVGGGSVTESRSFSSDTHGAFPVPGIRNDTVWLELQADCLAQPRRNLSLNEPVNWKSCLCWLCLFGTELCFLVPLSPNVKKIHVFICLSNIIYSLEHLPLLELQRL